MTSRQATLVVWAVLAGSMLGLQAAALVSKGARPGLGSCVRRVTSTRAGRVVLFLGWVWLGWHSFAR